MAHMALQFLPRTQTQGVACESNAKNFGSSDVFLSLSNPCVLGRGPPEPPENGLLTGN